MNKRIFLGIAVLLLCSGGVSAQSTDKRAYNDSGIAAGFFDSSEGEGNINFSNFHLPPLAVLFENARQNPQILSLAKAEELARAEVLKEKKNVFSFITGHASYNYGKTDLWGNNSTTLSSIVYQFQGSEQSYWNVGASLNVPLDKALDLGQAVKRKRLEAEKLEQDKNYAFDQLKLEIASLYIKITNGLIALKSASEGAAAYQGAGSLLKEDFENGNTSIDQFAWHKMHEMSTVSTYQSQQTQVMIDIVTLEILSHTPIITNSTTDITLIPLNDKDSRKQAEKKRKAEEKALEKQYKEDLKAEKAIEKKEAKAAKKEVKNAQSALKSQNKKK